MKLSIKSAFRGAIVAAGATVLIGAGATTASAQTGLDNIQYGDSGAGVTCVQKALTLWSNDKTGGGGWPRPSVAVDGAFGAETLKYVKLFQEAKGIDADGVVGKTTGELLYLEYLRPAGENYCYSSVPTPW
ncbi:peptidoglycan-binding domain-containing protein [Kitasatospora aureofaciens]|uniref:peptidoglycan-binding domain-containing protein n=1 Tax=Kitasatospora aureofaciens TaxID=1894 RepID=UPI003402FD05